METGLSTTTATTTIRHNRVYNNNNNNNNNSGPTTRPIYCNFLWSFEVRLLIYFNIALENAADIAEADVQASLR